MDVFTFDFEVSQIKAFQITWLIPVLHISAGITATGIIHRRKSAKTPMTNQGVSRPGANCAIQDEYALDMRRMARRYMGDGKQNEARQILTNAFALSTFIFRKPGVSGKPGLYHSGALFNNRISS